MFVCFCYIRIKYLNKIEQEFGCVEKFYLTKCDQIMIRYVYHCIKKILLIIDTWTHFCRQWVQ